eukprot:COSAG01_NODE_1471_length_10198_cov_4.595703_4_plen_275_part_00
MVGPGGSFGEDVVSALFHSDTVGTTPMLSKPKTYKHKATATATQDSEFRFLTMEDLSYLCTDYPTVQPQLLAMLEQAQTTRLAAIRSTATTLHNQKVSIAQLQSAERSAAHLAARRRRRSVEKCLPESAYALESSALAENAKGKAHAAAHAGAMQQPAALKPPVRSSKIRRSGTIHVLDSGQEVESATAVEQRQANTDDLHMYSSIQIKKLEKLDADLEKLDEVDEKVAKLGKEVGKLSADMADLKKMMTKMASILEPGASMGASIRMHPDSDH